MNKRKTYRNVLVAGIIFLIVFSCTEDPYYGEIKSNRTPTITLSSGPPEGDETVHKVEFSWLGKDPDGKIICYEFAMVSGDPVGFDPADTTGQDEWTRTYRTDSTFMVSAEEYDTNLTINNRLYARYHKTHTFFIRAIDNRGMKSQPAYRSFTAWTLAPYVIITEPVNPRPGQTQFLSNNVRFRWEAYDPVGAPRELQPADSIRYLWNVYNQNIMQQLNQHPEMFEERWTPWISYTAESDSGVSTRIGDDELLKEGHTYIIAVQAKDEAGAITSIFNNNNVRSFMAIKPTGPVLTVKEPYLGIYEFQGTSYSPRKIKVPAGFKINFSWKGDASFYGSIVSGFRYGWDITSIDDPSQWETEISPHVTSIPEKKFFGGTHTLFVESVDQLGVRTIGRIEIEIFQLSMPRNLLWVDDFYSKDFNQIVYAIPTESEHDRFWTNICSRAQRFAPEIDIYDTRDCLFTPPDAELIWNYKNIIWTCTSNSISSAWHELIKFTPESDYYKGKLYNYLPFYMQSGGHVWTLGKSDRRGGLVANIHNRAPTFPLNVKCEMMHSSFGCGDTTGATSMTYRDYCVNIIDKVKTPGIKGGPEMPFRSPERDALVSAFKDPQNPLAASLTGIPDTLTLWEEVIKDGRFFDPDDQGFTYVEIYNPGYWMIRNGLSNRWCFSPLFRMKTRSSFSPLNNSVIAFLTTRYAQVKADADGSVAAPSVHFGFPLWFFNRAQTNQIADAIFEMWNISVPRSEIKGTDSGNKIDISE